MNGEYIASFPTGKPLQQKPDLDCAVSNGMKKGRRIAALLCMASVYFGIDSILHGTLSVMASVSAVLTLIISVFLIYRNGAVFRLRQIPFILAAFLSGGSMCVVSSTLTKCIALISFILFLLSWCYLATRPSQKGDGNIHSLCDVLFAWFVMPFAGFAGLIAALFCPEKRKREKNSHPFLWTMAGLLVAVPITVAAAWLLLRGDELFNQIMRVILEDWWKYLSRFLLAAIVSIPFASALYSALDTNLSEHFPRERIVQKAKAGIDSVRCCPHTAALGATIPLCLLYLLFFGVQAGYFLSAFRKYLPDGFTFAEYARRGFFELCFVAVINLAVILLAVFFCRRKPNKKGGVLRLIVGALSIMTIALIAIAGSKMILYISSYGLTRLRFYTLAFMAFLAFVFLFLFLYAVLPRFRAVRFILAAFLAFSMVFSLLDADLIIAKFNTQRYLSGETEELDLDYFDKLSGASAAMLVPIAEDAADESMREEAQYRIQLFSNEYEEKPLLQRSLCETLAYRAVKKEGIPHVRSLSVQITLQLSGYDLTDLRSVALNGESWTNVVSAANMEPLNGCFSVDFSPVILRKENMYVSLQYNGYEMRSNSVSVSPEDGEVVLYLKNAYGSDEETYDLILETEPSPREEW